ncbi:MAG: hypothetical protein AB7P03_03030 [Kofleriaceae bacterium]
MYRPFAFVLAAASIAACADSGDEGLQIVKNVAPDTGCSFTSEATEPFLARGVANIVAPYYEIHPQILSRISAVEGEESLRTVFTTGARVDIEFPDETLFTQAEQDMLRDQAKTRFESLFSVPIAPNGGITDGSFVGIPESLMEAIRAKVPAARPGSPTSFTTTVITKSVVFGTLGDGEVTSQQFTFPVTICNNCLINIIGSCPLPMGSMVTNTGNACNPYQDQPVDCCTTTQGEVRCPAIIAQM